MRLIREWMLRLPWLRLPSRAPARAVPTPASAPPSTDGDVAHLAANVVAFPDPFVRHRAVVPPLQVLLGALPAAERTKIEVALRRAGHMPVTAGGASAATVDARLVAAAEGGGLVLIGSTGQPPCLLQRPLDPRRLLDALAAIAAQIPARTAPALEWGAAIVDPRTLDDLAGLGVGEAFVAAFVRQCIEDAEGALRLLRSAAVASRWSAVRDQLDALGGIAANLGLLRLQAAAVALGQLPDERLRRDWRAGLPALVSLLDEGRAVLRARATPGATAAEPA